MRATPNPAIPTGPWSPPTATSKAASPHFLLARLAPLFLAALLLAACEEEKPEPEPQPEPPLSGIEIPGPGGVTLLAPVSFEELPGWQQDRQEEALAAFRLSCEKFASLPPDRAQGPKALGMTAADWEKTCGWLPPEAGSESARAFFEGHFRPFSVLREEDPWGVITGYYEASVIGSLEKEPGFEVPLYKAPDDLLSLKLQDFDEDLPDRTLIARLEGTRLLPYHVRGAIDEGALEGRGLELLWLDDPVDAFFLSVQGSGVVTLPDGSEQRIGYAGNNGHDFYAIGRALLEEEIVPREKMTMQAIRDWLKANPKEAQELMQRNKRYIFFRFLDTSGPVGSQGVVLTPERSLAVDRAYLPLGAPLWLETESADPALTFQRLMIAQDSGAAITGGVRGDFFFGHGEAALARAGRMKEKGRYWLLLPNETAERLLGSEPGA